MSGGGTAVPSYPGYIQQTHTSLLTGETWTTDGAGGGTIPAMADPNRWGNVMDAMLLATSGIGGSPYAAVTAYDPADDLALVQTRYDDWATDLDAIDPSALMTEWVGDAVTLATTLVPTAEIDDAVNAFEARSQAAYMRNVSRFASGMFDIGAVMTSQFGMGLAQMELDRQDQLNDMDGRLRLLGERERSETARALTGQLSQIYLSKLQEQRAGIGGQLDISRIAASMYQDQIGLDLEYEVKDATWDLELFQYPMSNIGALSGALQTYKAQTKGERLAANIMTSASFGLQVGTALGSPGAGVAGGVGLLATQLLTGIA